MLNAAANFGVGDFGILGLASSEEPIVQAKDLADYAGSIEELWLRPSTSSVNDNDKLETQEGSTSIVC